MLKMGFVDEVRKLFKRGYDFSAPGMRTIGYAEILRHLTGSLPIEEAVRLIKKRTRIYSRKQMYFFRHLGPIRWYRYPNIPTDEILREARKIY